MICLEASAGKDDWQLKECYRKYLIYLYTRISTLLYLHECSIGCK